MNPLYTQLKTFGRVKANEPMSKHTTFKIGGPAEYFLTIDNTDKLIAALRYLDEENVPYFILGGGSNMLVSDDGYAGVVIRMQNTESKIQGDLYIADAGCPTVEVAQKTMAIQLGGFEWGVGVPGTIGGAVRGNAGAMGKDMHDDVYSVDVYRNGEVITLTNAECEFGYRHSAFKHSSDVILRVALKLTPYASIDQQAESKQKMLDFLKYRNTTQPKGFASTGCIFKNVEIADLKSEISDLKVSIPEDFLKRGKISAGWLVEQAEMKGARVGQAEVSPVHGNFIVNLGGATQTDVSALIEQVKDAVYEKTGLTLEEEIFLI
jgi:UDP-N-acetylmuramate dehydrogenase